jgi:hypothetical protein
MINFKNEEEKVKFKIANEIIDQLEKDIKEENLYALWKLIEHIPLNKQIGYLEKNIANKLKYELFIAKYPTNTIGLSDDVFNVVKNSLKLKANLTK